MHHSGGIPGSWWLKSICGRNVIVACCRQNVFIEFYNFSESQVYIDQDRRYHYMLVNGCRKWFAAPTSLMLCLHCELSFVLYANQMNVKMGLLRHEQVPSVKSPARAMRKTQPVISIQVFFTTTYLHCTL